LERELKPWRDVTDSPDNLVFKVDESDMAVAEIAQEAHGPGF
jgi:hypothetical protein